MKKNSLTLSEKLKRAYNKARKQNNQEAMKYYADLMARPHITACVSFEQFQGSWAYEQWKKTLID